MSAKPNRGRTARARKVAVTERDFRGHFICSEYCKFFRTTDVGEYRVSTIGDFHPTRTGGRQEIGYKRFYETMVFRLGPVVHQCDVVDCPQNGAREIQEWSEVEAHGYQSRLTALAGHRAIVRTYAYAADRDAK